MSEIWRDKFRIFLMALYLLAFTSIIYLAVKGWTYYQLPLPERPHHPMYQQWKPGGKVSHGLGVLGSLMMILLLLYSLRKRTRIFNGWGLLSHWLNIHIFFGIVGPLLVILHTTFKLNGLVSVSFWSMVAVALSGVFGRFIYIQIPRNIAGIELNKDDAKRMSDSLKNNIIQKYQLNEREFVALEKFIGVYFTTDSFFKSLMSLIFVDVYLFFKKRFIYRRIRIRFNIPRDQIKTLVNLTVQQAKLERRIQFWNQIQQIFHYWHVIHKPFAVVMYLIMIVHVAIAVWLGYTWF